jgi:hypothetical protein
MKKRTFSDLTVHDLALHPVWELVEDEGDAFVVPVQHLPATTMRQRVAGTQIRLADGTRLWALLGNLSVGCARSTKHFLTLSIHHGGQWFDLARYHDVDYARRDAKALAYSLGKPVKSVFPIEYDITELVVGSRESLAGKINAMPDERLSDEQLIQLSLESD